MKKIAVLTAFLLAASLFAGCAKEDLGEVTVENVGELCGMGATGIINRYAGVVVAEGEEKIEKKEDVEVTELFVKEGDQVTEGQELFSYDTTQMELNIDQMELDLERKKIALDTLRADLEKMQKEKEKAKEDQQLAYSLEIREIEANIQEAEYNIKLKEQEIEKNRAAMENASVMSPVSGRVQTINKNGGYDENGMPLPYITIVKDGSFRIKGRVDEANINALMSVTDVLIRSRVDDTVWTGFISEIDTENPDSQNNNFYYVDSNNSSTKYPFYVLPDMPDGLMMGQHVYIEPNYGQDVQEEAERMMLPEYYIVDADTDPYVFAQNDKGLLEKRKITLGAYDEMMCTWEVTEGLAAEDYIAYPDENVVEGMKCNIFTPEEPGIQPGGLMTETFTEY